MQPFPILPPTAADVASPETVATNETMVDDPAAADEIESLLEEPNDPSGLFVHTFNTVFDQALSPPPTQIAVDSAPVADVEAVGETANLEQVLTVDATTPEVDSLVSQPKLASSKQIVGESVSSDLPQPALELTPEISPAANNDTTLAAEVDLNPVQQDVELPVAKGTQDSPVVVENVVQPAATVVGQQQQVVAAAAAAAKPNTVGDVPEADSEIEIELQQNVDDGATSEEVIPPEEVARTSSSTRDVPAVSDFVVRQNSSRPNVELTEGIAPTTNGAVGESGDAPVPTMPQVDGTQAATGAPKPVAAQVLPTAAANMITSAVLETISTDESRVEVQLDPPELGTVWIELKASDDGMSATIVSEHDTTSQLLQDQLATLKKSLADSGVSVDEFSFDTASGNASREERSSAGSNEFAGNPLGGYSFESEASLSSQSTSILGSPGSSGIDVVA